MRNLPEIVCQRAQEQPDGIAYRFFHGASTPVELTFHALYEKAISIATRLQQLGLCNERVLLSCRSQKLFIIGFLGCLLAGCIAVPAPPPRRKVLSSRLNLLARNAAIRGVISDRNPLFVGENLPLIDMQAWETAEASAHARFIMPTISADSVAFLQYTSGSTSDPKGVAVTHGNLMENCAIIKEGMGLTPASSILTALPLFHDMGLVGGVLESMFVGCISSLMSPAEFVQFPERWLRIISDFKVTVSGGPNFMYDLVARNVSADQLTDCNFKAWEVAFCGAEPIRSGTIERFTHNMVPFGFRPEAFHPCYGMAESTLFITGKHISAMPEVCTHHGTAVVSCGAPLRSTRIEIVDPVTRMPLSELDIGEIWVEGGSVAAGYWRNPELTSQVFGVGLEDNSDSRFLRTGDLGYRKNGALFVTGRMKDLIIVYGKKYTPHDIEEEAEASHEALREAGGAAFSLNDDISDKLVLIFELKREWWSREVEWPRVKSAIRSAVNAVHGVAIDEIVLIKPGSLPRTSSGKVRRHQCRLDYLAGAFKGATCCVN